jgi:hypothetical protein
MKSESPSKRPFHQRVRAYLLGSVGGVLLVGITGGILAKPLEGVPNFLFNAILRTLASLFSGYVETIHRDIGEARSDRFVETVYVMLFVVCILEMCSLAVKGVISARSNHREAEEAKLKALVLRDISAGFSALQEKKKSIEEIEDQAEASDAAKEIMRDFDELKYKAKSIGIMKEKTKSPDTFVEEGEDALNRAKKLKTVVYYMASISLCSVVIFVVFFIGDVYTRKAEIFIERSIEIVAPTIPPERVLQLRAKYRAIDSAQKFYDLRADLLIIANDNKVTLPQFKVIRR